MYVCFYVYSAGRSGRGEEKGRYEQFKLSWTWSYYTKTHTLKPVHFGSELSNNQNIEGNKTINRWQCLWSLFKRNSLFYHWGLKHSWLLPLALLDRSWVAASWSWRHPRGWLQWRKCWTEVQLTEIRSLRSPDSASPSSVLVLHCRPGAEI